MAVMFKNKQLNQRSAAPELYPLIVHQFMKNCLYITKASTAAAGPNVKLEWL